MKRIPGKFEDEGHQGIYDRYKKEIANYLKTLNGKHVTDDRGHGWWEVPIDPKQKRTPLFGMGGAAAAGAAALRAPQDQPQEQ